MPGASYRPLAVDNKLLVGDTAPVSLSPSPEHRDCYGPHRDGAVSRRSTGTSAAARGRGEGGRGELRCLHSYTDKGRISGTDMLYESVC